MLQVLFLLLLFLSWNDKSGSPGPGSYEHPSSIKVKGPGSQPFGSGGQRFRENSEQTKLPGPGTYEHDVQRHRKMEYDGSFGGPQTLKWKGGVVDESYSATAIQTRQTKHAIDKEKKKQLRREAYLSLYWK
eukprot:m.3268 g.3268  ORF g.3268 m.3268 type:complete len:131 (+) comp9202_c0_seq1:576-968(+)